MSRVVITGIGVITPVGKDIKTFWKNIVNGKHGFSKIESFDTERFKAKLAGEIKDFHPEDYIDKKEAKRMDRFCQFAIAATQEAVADSGIDFSFYDPYRVGCIIGSGIGGIKTFETECDKYFAKDSVRISAFMIPSMISNMASGMISMRYQLKGSSFAVTSACASSTHAIGEAYRAIKHGYMDAVVVGGAEAVITPLAVGGFQNMQALSTSEDPDRCSMPFDKERNGFIMGEGAGILIMETYENAVKRGAEIYAEVAGYGSTSDAYHITSPDPEGEGAAAAMRMAVQDAGINISDVDYINAHGTSTPLNDKFETAAIKKVFGDYAYQLNVSSTKGVTGHLLGAAGAVEGIACCLAIRDSVIPPTANYKVSDPECDLNIVPNTAIQKEVNVAISNSLGFGGHNATVLFKKV